MIHIQSRIYRICRKCQRFIIVYENIGTIIIHEVTCIYSIFSYFRILRFSDFEIFRFSDFQIFRFSVFKFRLYGQQILLGWRNKKSIFFSYSRFIYKNINFFENHQNLKIEKSKFSKLFGSNIVSKININRFCRFFEV